MYFVHGPIRISPTMVHSWQLPSIKYTYISIHNKSHCSAKERRCHWHGHGAWWSSTAATTGIAPWMPNMQRNVCVCVSMRIFLPQRVAPFDWATSPPSEPSGWRWRANAQYDILYDRYHVGILCILHVIKKASDHNSFETRPAHERESGKAWLLVFSIFHLTMWILLFLMQDLAAGLSWGGAIGR